jgi:hypothetical protein
MPAHLKSFMRNSDCVQKKNIVPFLAFEKRVVTIDFGYQVNFWSHFRVTYQIKSELVVTKTPYIYSWL